MTGFLDALARLFGGRGSPRKPSGRAVVDLRYDGTTLSLEAPDGDGLPGTRWSGRLAGAWRMPPSNGTYLVEYDPPRRIAMRVPGDPPRPFVEEGEGNPGPFGLALPSEGFLLLRNWASEARLRNIELALRVTMAKARAEPGPSRRRDDDDDTTPTSVQADPYVPSQGDNQAAAQLAGLGYLRAVEDRNPERAPDPAPAPQARDDGPSRAAAWGLPPSRRAAATGPAATSSREAATGPPAAGTS